MAAFTPANALGRALRPLLLTTAPPDPDPDPDPAPLDSLEPAEAAAPAFEAPVML